MSNRKLPDAAYTALEGLQAQASASMRMLPEKSEAEKAKAREDLNVAHAQMAENGEWTRKIVKALMAGDGTTTAVTADAAWLESTFSAVADS